MKYKSETNLKPKLDEDKSNENNEITLNKIESSNLKDSIENSKKDLILDSYKIIKSRIDVISDSIESINKLLNIINIQYEENNKS